MVRIEWIGSKRMFACLALVVAAACDGGDGPTSPALSFAGIWSGQAFMETFVGDFDRSVCSTSSTVTLSQNGTTVTGTFRQETGSCFSQAQLEFEGRVESGVWLVGHLRSEDGLVWELSGAISGGLLSLRTPGFEPAWWELRQ